MNLNQILLSLKNRLGVVLSPKVTKETLPTHLAQALRQKKMIYMSWRKYRGPKGGKGWRDDHGNVVYGQKPPGSGGPAPSKPAAKKAEPEDSQKALAEEYADILNIYGQKPPAGVRDIIEDDLSDTRYVIGYQEGEWKVFPKQFQMSTGAMADDWIRQRNTRNEGFHWYSPSRDRKVYTTHKPGSSRERLQQRNADVSKLRDRLEKHAKGVELTKSQRGNANRFMAAMKRHHGDLAIARIDELYGEIAKSLDTGNLSPIQKIMLRQKLAGIAHVLGQPEEKPEAKPKVKAPWEGGKVEFGKVYNVPTDAIAVDPERFQFKLNVNKAGVTEELLGVKHWNPDFAGVIAAWQDPDDGKTYVVNGHHRRELAGRLGVDDLAIRYIDAKTAKEARGIGALINIAEGRGTSVDAAKFMRDSNVSVEDFDKYGVSLKGKLAQDAVVLTNLSDGIFDRLARGMIDPQKAIAVAKHLKDHDLQGKLFKLLDKREDEGKDLSTKVIEEMAREMAETPTTTRTEQSLWGDIESEDSLFVERAEIKSYVRNELAKELGDFQAVSSKRRAERVGVAGNIIDTERNKEFASEAEQSKAVFDKLVNSKGTISDSVNEMAEELAHANNKRARDAIKQKAVERIKQSIGEERQSLFGRKGADISGGHQTSGTAGPTSADAEDSGGESTSTGNVKPPEPGFTGFDALGREWRDGKLVPKQPAEPTKANAQSQSAEEKPIEAGTYKSKSEAQSRIDSLLQTIETSPVAMKVVQDSGLSLDDLYTPIKQGNKWAVGLTDKHKAAARATNQEEPAKPGGKEPWEMTREEHIADTMKREGYPEKARQGFESQIATAERDLPRAKKELQNEKSPRRRQALEDTILQHERTLDTLSHKRAVEKALAQGKPVPPEVLTDYPDLAGTRHS